MNYNVRWDDAAVEDVQRVYDEALDKEAVEHAVLRITLELSSNPLSAGESRERGTRILFKFPLVVWYHVEPRLPDVHIYQARKTRR